MKKLAMLFVGFLLAGIHPSSAFAGSLLGFLGAVGNELGIGDSTQPYALQRVNNAADPVGVANRARTSEQINEPVGKPVSVESDAEYHGRVYPVSD